MMFFVTHWYLTLYLILYAYTWWVGTGYVAWQIHKDYYNRDLPPTQDYVAGMVFSAALAFLAPFSTAFFLADTSQAGIQRYFYTPRNKRELALQAKIRQREQRIRELERNAGVSTY